MDNYGKPKQIYIDKIRYMFDNDLIEETSKMIWLAVYAANTPRSDYHWKIDACYEEWLDKQDGKFTN